MHPQSNNIHPILKLCCYGFLHHAIRSTKAEGASGSLCQHQIVILCQVHQALHVILLTERFVSFRSNQKGYEALEVA